jgi:CBS domain containing-hemolysin-like protein
MIGLLFALLCLLVAATVAVMRKSYAYVPRHEIKRRAEENDPLATTLYRSVAYGDSLNLLLVSLLVALSGIGTVLLVQNLSLFASIILAVVIFGLVYVWLPARPVSSFGLKLTARLTPLIAGVLNKTFPVLNRLSSMVYKQQLGTNHTGVFERADLLSLIDKQGSQTDSRINQIELDRVKNTLLFDDHLVGDLVQPVSAFKVLLVSDIIGPILINELHENPDGFALVREAHDGPVVGTIAAEDVSIRSSGTVQNVMKTDLRYLHENDSLTRALQAMIKTNEHGFLVIDNQATCLGVLRSNDVIRTLMGDLNAESDIDYSDPRAVIQSSRLVTVPQEETTDLPLNNEEAVYNSEEVIE